jgi:hypothetical protein
MPTYNGHPYSTTKNINLKGGLIRFGKTWSSNPFGSDENGIYINSSNQIIYSRQGVAINLFVGSVSPSLSPSLSPSKSPSLSPSISPSVSPT